MEQALFDRLLDIASQPATIAWDSRFTVIGREQAQAILRWGGVPLTHDGVIFEATGGQRKPENQEAGVETPTLRERVHEKAVKLGVQGVNEGATPRQRAEKRLRTAWEGLNAAEVEKVVPKAIEYGSGDLKLMGYAMKMLLNSPRARQRDWTEAESMEIAIAFYTLGKVAREFSAFEMGNMPSDDQPHDIGVYQRMAQVIRREGSWPPGFDEFLKEKE